MFELDLLFPTILERFCSRRIFNTEELLAIVRECATFIEMQINNERKRKLRPQQKFDNFSVITSFKYFHLEGVKIKLPVSGAFVAGVRLREKHIIFEQDHQLIKPRTVAEKLLLKRHMEADYDM